MDEKELERRLSLLSDFISGTNSKVNLFDNRIKALEEIFQSMKKAMVKKD